MQEERSVPGDRLGPQPTGPLGRLDGGERVRLCGLGGAGQDPHERQHRQVGDPDPDEAGRLGDGHAAGEGRLGRAQAPFEVAGVADPAQRPCLELGRARRARCPKCGLVGGPAGLDPGEREEQVAPQVQDPGKEVVVVAGAGLGLERIDELKRLVEPVHEPQAAGEAEPGVRPAGRVLGGGQRPREGGECRL
ncbi:MAG: hypothetical protein NZ555_11095, partial [Geminicoccaceae bacterium]|nr:hypothetical protein [Geminicoccaceae bacterium]